MNNANRKELQRGLDLIAEAKEIFELIKDEEQEKFDNLSEGLQQTENGQRFETNVDTLDNAISSLEEVESYIEEAME